MVLLQVSFVKKTSFAIELASNIYVNIQEYKIYQKRQHCGETSLLHVPAEGLKFVQPKVGCESVQCLKMPSMTTTDEIFIRSSITTLSKNQAHGRHIHDT